MISDYISKAKTFLFARRHAYRATFLNPLGETVLEDLARFCRAHRSTGHTDTHLAARLDGRREVWLRIAHHLRLTEDQMWQLFTQPKEK